MPKPTLNTAMEAIARNLREFGYGDVTGAMVREIYDQWKTGKRFPDLGHGVVGGFAESQFAEHQDMLAKLEATP